VSAIQVEGLRKRYGDLVAVNGVSLEVEPGRIFGLLGPNGAGKSTLIGCISGLLRPSEGRVRVLGHDVVEEPIRARERLGVVPQELGLYEELSAADNASYWGAAYGLSGGELRARVHEILERMGLSDRAREPVSRFSGGMKRRLNLACGLVHRPRVLLLDEPTVGVDPQSRVRLLELVREEVAGGTSVLYTTHYMEEAQELCDRIAIVDRGRVIASGSMGELRGLMEEKDLLRLSGSFDLNRARRALGALDDIEVLDSEADSLRLSLVDASKRLPAIFTALTEAGSEIRETRLTQPNLETLFIKLTGRELRE